MYQDQRSAGGRDQEPAEANLGGGAAAGLILGLRDGRGLRGDANSSARSRVTTPATDLQSARVGEV